MLIDRDQESGVVIMPRGSYVTLLTLGFGLQLLNGIQGPCKWPLSLRFSTWLDSSHGELHFNDTTMWGWKLNVDGISYSPNWQCFYFDEHTYEFILGITDPIKFKDSSNYVYVCLILKRVTEYSYRYYVNCGSSPQLNNERGILLPIKVDSPIKDHFCSDDSLITEYRMLIKLGTVPIAAVNCPRSIQGSFSYEIKSQSGSSVCNSSSSAKQICISGKHVQFHNEPCAMRVAYSVSGALMCVENLELNGTNYVMMYNYKDLDQEIDKKKVFRFICLAISSSRTELSISPVHCQVNQMPYEIPKSLNGSVITLAAISDICVTQDGGIIWAKSLFVLVGGTCGGGVVLAGVFVGIIIYCRRKKRSEKTERFDLPPSVQDMCSSKESIRSDASMQNNSDIYINLQDIKLYQRSTNVKQTAQSQKTVSKSATAKQYLQMTELVVNIVYFNLKQF